MTDYMAIDTELPPYFFFPWFLLDMGLTLTAKLTYALLLDRARLSQFNGWSDETGRVYIIFPIGKLAELEAVGLIERRRQQFSKPNHIYVKLPDGQRFSHP